MQWAILYDAAGHAAVGLPSLSGSDMLLGPSRGPVLDPDLANSMVVPSGGQGAARISTVTCAVANVQTLNPKEVDKEAAVDLQVTEKMAATQTILSNADVQVAGIIETRMPTQGIRHLAAYTCFCSPATAAGRDGVEVWISKDIPFVVDGQEVLLRPSMVHTQVVAPTMLLLALHVKHARLDVCAAHAPTSKATRLQKQQWWDKLESALAEARDPSVPLYLLVDANARLGSTCSEAVGATTRSRRTTRGSACAASRTAATCCFRRRGRASPPLGPFTRGPRG